MRMVMRRNSAATAKKMQSGSTLTASGLVIRDEIRKQHGKGFLSLNAKRGTGSFFHAAAPDRAVYKTGMYLSAGSAGRDDFRGKTEDAILESGGDALLIEVKGGDIYFQSTSPMAQKFGTIHPIYDLPAVVAETQRQIFEMAWRYAGPHRKA